MPGAARYCITHFGGLVEPSSVKRRLTCILAADAVGYSKQIGDDEEGTIRVLAAHRAVIDGIITFHQGRIVSTAGDSVLAEFPSVVEAVRCAVEIQEALKTRNDSLPENRQMHFRIGVNLGDVVVKNDDLLGDGVNVAARLETMAEPGGICISSSVYDQITGKLDLGFQDIGEQNLKNISRPIHVYRVSGASPPLRVAPAVLPAASSTSAASSSRKPVSWAIGAVVALMLGAAVAWQGGWLRFGATEGAGQPMIVAAPVATPQSAPATENNATTSAVIDANATRAQAEAEVRRLRSEADSIKRQADAELARARSETAAARSRTKADADAARSNREKETMARAAEADVAKTTVAPRDVPAKAPDTAAVASLPSPIASEKVSRSVSGGAGRFDGTWNVTVECTKHTDGALGYTLEFVAQVKDGLLRGEKGVDGTAGSLRLEGEIQPEGNAKLYAKGRTGDPKFNVNNVQSGAPYSYDVVARFEGSRGTGRRVQLRTCDLTFAKQ